MPLPSPKVKNIPLQFIASSSRITALWDEVGLGATVVEQGLHGLMRRAWYLKSTDLLVLALLSTSCVTWWVILKNLHKDRILFPKAKNRWWSVTKLFPINYGLEQGPEQQTPVNSIPRKMLFSDFGAKSLCTHVYTLPCFPGLADSWSFCLMFSKLSCFQFQPCLWTHIFFPLNEQRYSLIQLWGGVSEELI